jgi:hypothetical protein
LRQQDRAAEANEACRFPAQFRHAIIGRLSSLKRCYTSFREALSASELKDARIAIAGAERRRFRAGSRPREAASRSRFHKLHVEIDPNFISDQNFADFQRRIPRQSEIFSDDDGARRARHPNVAPRIFGDGRNAVDVELNITGDAANG